MKLSLVFASLLTLVSTAPVEPPYHYEVNSTSASLDGKSFLTDSSVIVEQGGPFAITLSAANWALFTDIVYNHTGLDATTTVGMVTIDCCSAHLAKFNVDINGEKFDFTGADISSPAEDKPGQCLLNVYYKVIDANYFGQQFIDNVLHGKLLPGKWLGPGPQPANWKE
ncbi:hypothetical protein CJU90_3321 [Yarrowia sp. C11]|nr:hypothetical protein CKK34_4767 [Yarrowia sp. E02]KAG5369791.1 hypothetical protein CJU90_3321 [Yarrowia sp. C11]